jgi:flavin-binding protein dodecin
MSGREEHRIRESRGRGGTLMSVARNTEISVESTKSFDDAIREGIDRATKTLRNVRGAWIKEQALDIEGDRITRYKVTMIVTFVLE